MTTISESIKQRKIDVTYGWSSYFDLLSAWTLRTVRIRYKQSVLGVLWALIQPVVRAVFLTIIFTRFVPIDTGDTPYIVFSYSAMIPWIFLSSSLSDMVVSLTSNVGLVSKIYFPREILPVAALLARLLDFAVAAVLLVVMMIFYGIPFLTSSWLFLPLTILIQIALTLGLGLASAALNVFYRDVNHMISFGVQLWFYATPIIYPADRVPEQLRSAYYILNPMGGIIVAYRKILLEQQPPDTTLLISALATLPILVFGYWLFKRLEFQFADVV